MINSLIHLTPEFAQILTKWVTIASVVFGVLSGLSIGVTFLCQTVISDASDRKILAANQSSLEAKNKSLQAELQVEKIKNAIVWREVNDNQRNKLKILMNNKPNKVIIYYSSVDPESYYYANSIGSTFISMDVPVFYVAVMEIIDFNADLAIYCDNDELLQSYFQSMSDSNFDVKIDRAASPPAFGMMRIPEGGNYEHNNLIILLNAKKAPTL